MRKRALCGLQQHILDFLKLYTEAANLDLRIDEDTTVNI
jgi:hypothetical protein